MQCSYDLSNVASNSYQQEPNKKPPKIILVLQNEQTKVAMKKRNRRKLTLASLGYKESDGLTPEALGKQIYINENLTPTQGHINFLARNYKREHSWKYCWTRNGMTYLRKTDSSDRIAIRSEADLKSLSE